MRRSKLYLNNSSESGGYSGGSSFGDLQLGETGSHVKVGGGDGGGYVEGEGAHIGIQIADVSIWKGAIDSDSIAVLYNSGDGPIDPRSNNGDYDQSGDLIVYWPFTEGTGSTVEDTEGSFDLTLGATGTTIPSWKELSPAIDI
jgi:hypothetical protein